MNKIEIEIPEGKRAEWINGVLTLVDELQVEFKFNVGDRVTSPPNNYNHALEITEQVVLKNEPWYRLRGLGLLQESELVLCSEPQDITERIKTFEDAFNWCFVHDNVPLIEHSILAKECFTKLAPDLVTFIILRIIVTALNEGWEPKDNDFAYFPIFMNDGRVVIETQPLFQEVKMPKRLLFRTQELAAYAANQFRDIYADFCGMKKGGEE